MVDPRPLLEIEVRPLGAIARARPCAPAEAARSAIFALIRMLAKTIGLSMRNRAYSGSCRGIARPKAATWSITSVEFRHLLGRQESLQAAASTRRARIPKGGWLRRLAVRARAPTPDTPRRAQRRVALIGAPEAMHLLPCAHPQQRLSDVMLEKLKEFIVRSFGQHHALPPVVRGTYSYEMPPLWRGLVQNATCSADRRGSVRR